jgi:hypothetical protein
LLIISNLKMQKNNYLEGRIYETIGKEIIQ